MPTFECPIVDHQLIFIVAVCIPEVRNQKSCNALLDTGAQSTLISPRVVGDLGLSAIGFSKIGTVSGEVAPTKKYRVRVDIPIGDQKSLPDGRVVPDVFMRGKEFDVLELPYQPNNFDVIRGLNFISAFHLTMFRGNLIFSN